MSEFVNSFDTIDGFPNRRDIVEYVDSFLLGYSYCFPYQFDIEIIKVIACQSALESDYGNSKICTENCNLFGMKLPKVRPNFAIGENRLHAKYSCYNDSVRDYVLWVVYNRPTRKQIQNVSLFLDFLKDKGYCPSNTYKATVYSLYYKYSTLKNSQNEQTNN